MVAWFCPAHLSEGFDCKEYHNQHAPPGPSLTRRNYGVKMCQNFKKKGLERSFQNLSNPYFHWCLERESNSHGRKAHEILSLGCLPVPPSRQVGCFYHIGLNLVNPDEMVKMVSSVLCLLVPMWHMDTRSKQCMATRRTPRPVIS